MTPGVITGPVSTTFDGNIYVQYSIDPVVNTLFYKWSVPSGVTILGKNDSTAVILDIPAEANGELIVAAGNTCGLSSSLQPRSKLLGAAVEVNSNNDCIVPPRPGAITGPIPIQGNGNLVKFSIDPVISASYYVWTIPEGAIIIGSNCDDELVLDLSVASDGEITVAAANDCGSSPSLHPQSIQVNLPD